MWPDCLTARGERKIHLQSSPNDGTVFSPTLKYKEKLSLSFTLILSLQSITVPQHNHFRIASYRDSQPSANTPHSCCLLLAFSLCERFFPFIPFVSAIVSLTILWAIPTTSSSLCCQIRQDQERSPAEKPAALSVMLVHGTVSPGSCSINRMVLKLLGYLGQNISYGLSGSVTYQTLN